MSKYPKPLKGGDTITFDPEGTVATLVGAVLIDPIILGGTINNTIIGNEIPSDAWFTNITVSGNTSTSTITDVTSVTFAGGSSIVESSGDLNITSISNINLESPVNVTGNTVISGDLTVIGTINNVPVTPPLGMTVENLNGPCGTPLNVSHLLNITFLEITSGVGTITTGTLSDSVSIDGFYKLFIFTGKASSNYEYHLTVTNLCDPQSQVVSNKLLKFKYTGQSVILIFSTVKGAWFLLPGGSV